VTAEVLDYARGLPVVPDNGDAHGHCTDPRCPCVVHVSVVPP
jgi:hypothetical protein